MANSEPQDKSTPSADADADGADLEQRLEELDHAFAQVMDDENMHELHRRLRDYLTQEAGQ